MTTKEPGLNNSTTSYVRAGMSDVFSGDGRAQVMEFLPKDLTVKSGDTVGLGLVLLPHHQLPNYDARARVCRADAAAGGATVADLEPT